MSRPKPKSNLDEYEEMCDKGGVVRYTKGHEIWDNIVLLILHLGLIGMPFYVLYRIIFG